MDVNYLAIALAAVASFVFGAGWYMALAKIWMAASGMTEEDVKDPSPLPFVLAFLCQLVMAWVLAGLIGHVSGGDVTIGKAVVSAVFVWLGFVATTLITNHQFQNQSPKLTLVDGGHWLGVLAIQGFVIGALA